MSGSREPGFCCSSSSRWPRCAAGPLPTLLRSPSPKCSATSIAASWLMSSSAATCSTIKRTDGRTFRTIAPANYVTGECCVRVGPRAQAACASTSAAAPERQRLQLRRAGARSRLHWPARPDALPRHERPYSRARKQDARGRSGIHHDHVRRRGRCGRSEGRSEGDRRLPARAGTVLRHRRPHSEGRAARRAARHRQDAARAVDRRRGEGAVSVRERLRLRRDVRRRRRVAHPQAVQGCAASSRRASCSSTSSTPSDGAAAATRSATKSASRR